MDQLRTVVNILWTQRFWVLTVVGTIVGTVFWSMAATDLDAQFKERKGKIDGAFASVTSISGEAMHPNENVNQGDMIQAILQRDYVLKVWKELYEKQRAEVLYWPEHISKEFVAYMDQRQFGDNIRSDMRGFYHNYIETQFDALVEIVKAKKTADRNAGGRGGGYGGEGRGYGGEGGDYGGGGAAVMSGDGLVEEDYLVQWLDQGKVQQKLLFKTKPSALKVWVTQEDLWVYETLLNVIADTNKARGATIPDNTAVRVILNLQVGSEAAVMSAGKVLIPQGAAAADGEMGDYGGGEMGGFGGGEMGGYAGGEMGGFGGGEMGGFGGGEMGGYGGREGTGAEGGGDAALVANRYLDAEGNPDPGSVEGPFGTTEFRQLPIRMKLSMDERWIPRLLIECANATLPIEVKQLRINPSQSGIGLGGRGAASRPSPGLRGVTPGTKLAEVEIRGVVYIYNEPDTSTLTVPGEVPLSGDGNSELADDSI